MNFEGPIWANYEKQAFCVDVCDGACSFGISSFENIRCCGVPGLKFCCRFNIFLFVKIIDWKTFFPHKISDCEVDLCVVQHIFFVLISCMNQKLNIMDATES